MEIGRKNKVEGAYPLDHSPGLRFHLRREESLAEKLQLTVPNGRSYKFARKWPEAVACLNKTDMRSVDGEILIFRMIILNKWMKPFFKMSPYVES